MNDQEKNPMVEALMQQMASDNPKMFALMQMMQNKSSSQETIEPQVDISTALKKEVRKRKRLIKQYQELATETELLESLLDELAAALGACPSCWGSHEKCNMCGGKGKPGAFRPDKELFQHYVLPILKNNPWVRQMFLQELNN